MIHKPEDTTMISRIAPYLAASALMLTTSFAMAQTTLTPAPSAPPSAAAPGAGSGSGSGSSIDVAPSGRQRGERREGRGAMGACRADMQALCGNVERGKGNKIACLIENRTKASPECQAAITAVDAARSGKAADKAAKRAEGGKRGERGGKMAVCRADSKALCADVERGGGRKVACLKANEAKLSPDCAGVLKSLPSRG
jgi:hypothetical protein